MLHSNFLSSEAEDVHLSFSWISFSHQYNYYSSFWFFVWFLVFFSWA